MYDIITIGSSLIDSFIRSSLFTAKSENQNSEICLNYGEKNEIDEYIIKTGGGGSNTAVGFSRMGYRTGVITEIGNDEFSKIILDDFRKEYVSTNLVISEKHENTGGSIILLGDDGGRTVMVHRGASSMLDPRDIPAEALSRTDWVHLSSISGQLDTLKKIFTTLKKDNKAFSWNPGKKELKLIAEGKLSFKDISCEILFLNKEEWESIKDQQKEAQLFTKQVIVTNGKKGGQVFVDESMVAEFKSGDAKSVDDTGAGDSFVVGYVTAHLKGKILRECCEWGKRNAVSVIGYVGSKPGLLTINQMKVHN
ncbi:carbohydrate kinase family protein [Candidatus Woesebacteria bacterium]|nr:carbohydrate kinase family protein [Candidatus Woesebacteria bacterium]